MTLELLLFWPLCALTMAGALSTALARNLVYAALSLGATLTGVAGLYFFLQAEFLAAVQLTVYVGGILILILFGVMFSRDILGQNQRPRPAILGLGILASLVTLVGMVRTSLAVVSTTGLVGERTSTSQWIGNFSPKSPFHLGDLLATTYLVPFLSIAILLTVVLVGALVLVRKEGE
jgi:NADH-quinone oxidoreductase subunit J